MTTYRWSFLEDVTAYRSQGIESIGVWRHKLSEFGEERGAELIRESGLTVSSLSSAGGFTGSDGDSFRDSVADALDALKLAAQIGAECLVVVSGARAYHTKNHAARLLRDALVELGDAGVELGVQIAVQPMMRGIGSRWTFLNTLDATVEALLKCHHPSVGMVFDTYHLGREVGLGTRMNELVPFIKLVSLSDGEESPASSHRECDRVLPGEGTLPVQSIVHALDAAGYSGAYEMQILSETAWNSDYPTLLRRCREAFQTLCPVPASLT